MTAYPMQPFQIQPIFHKNDTECRQEKIEHRLIAEIAAYLESQGVYPLEPGKIQMYRLRTVVVTMTDNDPLPNEVTLQAISRRFAGYPVNFKFVLEAHERGENNV